jgi:hypothetical protein
VRKIDNRRSGFRRKTFLILRRSALTLDFWRRQVFRKLDDGYARYVSVSV